MTSIPLRNTTIRSYMGSVNFNSCHDISEVHLNVDDNVAKVKARIPASSTRQGYYDISVRVRLNGTAILGSSCSCPVGRKCKHIYKVLRRIASPEPIRGPSQRVLQRAARRRQYLEQMERASVYIALACKSELDSGSDFRRSYYIKDNFDQKILGVFFSLAQANQCAKEYCRDELGHEDEDEDMDEDDDEDDDEEEPFVFDGSDFGEYDDENAFDKVWVERRAIQDASSRFHE